jgi:hypothetical protein
VSAEGGYRRKTRKRARPSRKPRKTRKPRKSFGRRVRN